ncbi:MAG: hypothetical protein MJ188_08070 [Treponema sp.]|nr:hypothetical protein [Treponema sp.]
MNKSSIKIALCLLFVTLLSTSLYAADSNLNLTSEKDESKWSDMTYNNVPILKILEGKDGYVIIYEKNKLGTGTTVIPKAWAKGTPENPRKLKFRNIKNPGDSFLTVVKKNGEFSRVIISTTLSKNNSLWGVVDYSKPLDGANKETLEELEF